MVGYAGTDASGRDYYDEAKRNLERQRDRLKDIQFISIDYRDINADCSVIYCDIPYSGTKQYSTSSGFSHVEFWNWAREMSVDNKNIVIISEYTAPEDFECIYEKEVTCSVGYEVTNSTCERLFIHNSLVDSIGFGKIDSFDM